MMNEDSVADSPLDQYIGNYRLLRLLGWGGNATVYLGEHRYLKRLAAIKVLRTVLNDQDKERFLEEARLLANLSHPHIVQVHEFAVTEKVNRTGNGMFTEYTPYLVMDFAPGKSLRALYSAGSCLFIDIAVGYAKQIAAALQYAHNRGIIHRDVKPENCLLNEQQEVMLSDFGLALFAPTPDLLSTQQMAGTLPYTAPEQLRGKPGFASDQYSLGVMAYEWLCGHRPFDGEEVEIIMKHISSPPPSLRSQNPAISQAVEEVVLKALEKDPQRRYPSVQEFANALEHASQWDKSSMTPPSHVSMRAFSPDQNKIDNTFTPSPLPIPSRRKKKITALIIGIITFILILGGIGTFYLKTSTTSRPAKTRPTVTQTAIKALPPLPGAADFTIKPPSIHGMTLVTDETSFEGDHAALGAGQQVVVDFSLPGSPQPGKPIPGVSVSISALVARSGNNHGFAPVDLYSNGRIFVQDFTSPGEGFQTNVTSFQIPPGQLVYGKNEIKLLVAANALGEFWLYHMGIILGTPN